MTTKTIAWTTGSGDITLTYTGQGNGSISVASDENDSFDDRSQSFNIVTTNGSPEQAVSILIKQKGKALPIGEVYNFEYTGNVQQITLPKGSYKLQCWGAQGGTSYGSSSGAGSKGGYSEGVLTLTQMTTLYIFVGGQGSRGSFTSLVNGGWNGGGASVGYSYYNSGDTNGYSYPACGGGATDISTVTSSMSYSGGRTNRSSASLLARCIVAGGGAGGSYRCTSITTTEVNWISQGALSYNTGGDNGTGNGVYYATYYFPTLSSGTFKIINSSLSNVSYINYQVFKKGQSSIIMNKNINFNSSFEIDTSTYPEDTYRHRLMVISTVNANTIPVITGGVLYKQTSVTSTDTSSSYSNKSQQGGGTSGKGQYPGTQSSAGTDGGFGYGASQSSTNYRYCAGGGGGGWYGGGTNKSDSSESYINYSGGGSGFVNTAANASYRPSGYTGLQLDSGTTTAGNISHPSTSGGTETGHSGNGYAKITVLSQ